LNPDLLAETITWSFSFPLWFVSVIDEMIEAKLCTHARTHVNNFLLEQTLSLFHLRHEV
jgi:hypothetical protein